LQQLVIVVFEEPMHWLEHQSILTMHVEDIPLHFTLSLSVRTD
jgi:hypothetical protein